MTKAEWLACADPSEMFSIIHVEAICAIKVRWFQSWRIVRWFAPKSVAEPRRFVTNRKLYLLACSIDRVWWPATQGPTPLPPRVDLQERFVEGEVTLAELQSGPSRGDLPWDDPWDLVDHMINRTIVVGDFEQSRVYCDLVRDIFNYPFRSVHFNPAWRTDTVLSLAKQMYDSRDFGAMPILADALQDAGCEVEEILNHCRDAEQVHVRGCWVVDLVLGKE